MATRYHGNHTNLTYALRHQRLANHQSELNRLEQSKKKLLSDIRLANRNRTQAKQFLNGIPEIAQQYYDDKKGVKNLEALINMEKNKGGKIDTEKIAGLRYQLQSIPKNIKYANKEKVSAKIALANAEKHYAELERQSVPILEQLETKIANQKALYEAEKQAAARLASTAKHVHGVSAVTRLENLFLGHPPHLGGSKKKNKYKKSSKYKSKLKNKSKLKRKNRRK